jgi:hypothetical protein
MVEAGFAVMADSTAVEGFTEAADSMAVEGSMEAVDFMVEAATEGIGKEFEL